MSQLDMFSSKMDIPFAPSSYYTKTAIRRLDTIIARKKRSESTVRSVSALSSRKNRLVQYLSTHWELYLFILPALIYIIMYEYVPMYGVQIAFRDFKINKGITGSDWAGLKYFTKFLGNPMAKELIGNTLRLSIYGKLVSFPLTIIFALVLNEVPFKKFKSLTQTVSYAPHFISMVVMCSMITMFLREQGGLVNNLLGLLGVKSFNFMGSADAFPHVFVWSGVWQGLGWSTIIYISALSGIDQELHEAAMIDGASRLKRIWHIDLPGILPTVSIMLIMSMSSVMSVGFEKAFLLQNDLNLETSEIISTFVYKMGLKQRQYSYSAAIGLFNNVINMILLLITNAITRKLSETSLF